MNNLKCRKQGFNKYICKRTNKEIKLCDCKNCPYKEYKDKKCTTIMKKSSLEWKNAQKSPVYCTKMKKKSSKLTKLERNRFSLFTDNMSKCYFCPNKKDHTHEIFCGRNRQNSMRYGLCLPICESCHRKYQNDSVFNEEWHIKGQLKFIEVYPNLRFEDIFRINYLDK